MPSPASIVQPRLPQTFASLRHRNFKIYLLGQTASLAGTWMQIVAQGWLVYQISKSEFTLGLVAFASAIPALIISPWGGVLIDRIPANVCCSSLSLRRWLWRSSLPRSL